MLGRWQSNAVRSGRFPHGLYLIATAQSFATADEVVAAAEAAKMHALIDYLPLSHVDREYEIASGCVLSRGVAAIGAGAVPSERCRSKPFLANSFTHCH